jgi:hypothetical protein
MLAMVVALLQTRGDHSHALKLACGAKEAMIALGRGRLEGKHPVAFLEEEETEPSIRRSSYLWLSIRQAIVEGAHVMPPPSFAVLSTPSLRYFESVYRGQFRGKLALAQELSEGKYTFHLTTLWEVRPTDKAVNRQRAEKTGGFLAGHRFICLHKASSLLLLSALQPLTLPWAGRGRAPLPPALGGGPAPQHKEQCLLHDGVQPAGRGAEAQVGHRPGWEARGAVQHGLPGSQCALH